MIRELSLKERLIQKRRMSELNIRKGFGYFEDIFTSPMTNRQFLWYCSCENCDYEKEGTCDNDLVTQSDVIEKEDGKTVCNFWEYMKCKVE